MLVLLLVWYAGQLNKIGKPTSVATVPAPTGTVMPTVLADVSGFNMFTGSGSMADGAERWRDDRAQTLQDALRPATATPGPVAVAAALVGEDVSHLGPLCDPNNPACAAYEEPVTPTPTVTPSPTPPPLLAGVVSDRARELNCRYGPGMSWPIMARLRSGEPVLATGRALGVLPDDGFWWIYDNGRQCWVKGTYITADLADYDLNWLPLRDYPPPSDF